MKPRILSTARLSFPLASAIAALLTAQFAQSATYYWDNNGTTAGFGTAAGVWAAPTTGSATQGWSTSTTGVTLPGSITTLSTGATTDAVNFGNGATGLAAGTITVSGTVQSGSMTFASGSGAIVLSGGTINLTNAATGPTLTVNNASNTIGSNLTGGLATSTISKAGTGTLILSGTNTHVGITTLSAGVLVLGSANALPGGIANTGGTGALSFSGGALGLGSGDFTRNYGGITAGTIGRFDVLGNTGPWWAAYGADRNVNVNNSGATLTTFNGKPFNFGAADSTHMVTYMNGVNMTTGTRDVRVYRGSTVGGIDAQFSGNLTTSGANMAGWLVSGGGTIAFTGANTFSGRINVFAGITVVNSLLDTGLASPIGQGTSGIGLAGGTFKYAPVSAVGGGGHSTNHNFTITASSSLDASGTGALVFNTPSGSIISPDITGLAFTATGTNKTLTLTTPSNLAIGMAVTGPGIASGSTVASFNATTVNLTSSGNVTSTSGSATFGTPTARTLTLTGTNTGTNTIAGILQDSSATGAGVLSLTKASTGTWALSGLNTFTGNVTVSGGLLVAGVQGTGAGSALGTASGGRTITVNTGGTLRSDVGSLFNNNFASDPTNLPAINLVGGTLTNTGTLKNSAIGNVTLTGGTLDATVGSATGYGSWNLNGTVTSTGTSTISSSASVPITLSAASGTTTIFNVTSGTLTASATLGEVTGTGGSDDRISSLSKTGAGTMVLSAANTYTGGTTVNGGTLLLSGAVDMPATGALQVNSGGTFSLADGTARTTSAASLNLADGAKLTFDWNAGAVDTLVSTAAATTAGSVLININPLNSPSGTGLTLISSPSGGLSGATYLLVNNTGNSLTVSDTAVLIGSGSATPLTSAYWLGGQISAYPATMSVSSSSSSNWASDASGTLAGGVVPGSACDVFFSATGAVQQSNVVLGADMSVNSLTFNDATPVTIGVGNTLTLNSAGTGASSAISVNQSATINSGVALGANSTWTVASATDLAVGGVVSGGFSLSKAGAGSLILNSANIYSGATTVNDGVLKLGNAAALGAGTGAPDGTTVSSGATLDLGGVSNGANSAAGSERLTVSGSGVGGNGAIFSSSAIATPFIGVRYLTLAGDTTLGFANRWDVGSSTAANNAFAGGGYTLNFLGTGPDAQVSLNFLGATDLGDINVSLGSDSTKNILYLQGDTTLGQPGKTLTISGGSTLDFFTNVSVTNYDKKIALDNGILKFEKTSTTFTLPGTIGLTNANTINTSASTTAVSASGVISGLGSLTKSGSGTLTLSGANEYSGGTTLTAGTVAISNAASFGTGNVLVTGSSRINATGGITYANAVDVGAALSLSNAGTSNSTATYSGQLTGASPITVVNNGNNGILGEHLFTNTNNTFTGNILMPAGSTGPATGNDTFSFASIGDGGNFTFQKRGHTNAIAYTGSSAITFNTRQIVLGAEFGNGLYDGGGVNPINRFMNNGTGTVTFNTNLTPGAISTVSASATFFFDGTNTGDNTFAGIISNPTNATILGIGKNGGGKWILSGANSYTGNATIADGTLSVNAIDVVANNQPLGKSSLIQLGNSGTSGTLEYTGASNASTDKQVVLGNLTANGQTGAGGIVNNSPTGTLTFSNPSFNSITGATVTTVSRTLTLGGSNTGANTIQGIIRNNATSAAVALTKSGTGTWKLSGANTYTGDTTVSDGTLELADDAQLKFVLGASSGSNNKITGAGTLTLDGDFVIDTAAANALASGTWTIVANPTLVETYATNFTVAGFTPVGTTKWEKTNGPTKKYTFDETTGILTLETLGYAAWAALNSASATNLDEDHDNDGVPNGIEYFIGGPSGNTTGFTALPTVNTTGGLSVTWAKAADYAGTYGTDFWVETSSTLTGTWATEASPGPTISFPSATEVKFTFPTPLGSKNFARLKVTGP